jgi:hypothetical protein
MEPNKFCMSAENVDCLDRVVNQFDGVFEIGLFQVIYICLPSKNFLF